MRTAGWPGTSAAVSGAGSLPFVDPEQAIAFVARHAPRVPFWPQLPRRGALEGMVAQCLAARTAGGDDPWDAACAAGFFAFERALAAGAFPRAALVKGQVAGPLTLAAAGRIDLDEACARVEAIATFQAQRLLRASAAGAAATVPVVIVLDEPCLGAAPLDARHAAALARVLDSIARAGARTGLHCCARFSAALLDDVPVDVLSFDADRGAALLLDPALAAFVARGGLVFAGVVPTERDADVDAAARRIDDAWSALPRPAARPVVTAACGLGLRSVERAERSFDAAARIALRVAAGSGAEAR